MDRPSSNNGGRRMTANDTKITSPNIDNSYGNGYIDQDRLRSYLNERGEIERGYGSIVDDHGIKVEDEPTMISQLPLLGGTEETKQWARLPHSNEMPWLCYGFAR